jgi:hypothetical protein
MSMLAFILKHVTGPPSYTRGVLSISTTLSIANRIKCWFFAVIALTLLPLLAIVCLVNGLGINLSAFINKADSYTLPLALVTIYAYYTILILLYGVFI